MEYNFRADKVLEHLERHFGKEVVGSRFVPGWYFNSPEEVIEFALDHIQDEYQGVRLEKEVELQEAVGLDSLVSIR